MIVDSSAIISVLRGEPDAPELLSVMLGAKRSEFPPGRISNWGSLWTDSEILC
ncbi:MAG: type II toxin-antitoxin system VapC family toxin [Ornithinimicrobium sp.]